MSLVGHVKTLAWSIDGSKQLSSVNQSAPEDDNEKALSVIKKLSFSSEEIF